MGWVRILLLFIRGILRDRTELAAENLALRQQLAALHHKSKRPRLRKRDRIFWAILSRIWPNWRSALLIVQPDTVVPGNNSIRGHSSVSAALIWLTGSKQGLARAESMGRRAYKSRCLDARAYDRRRERQPICAGPCSGCATVPMMEATDLRNRDNLAALRWFDFSFGRRIPVKRQMRSRTT